MSRDAAAAVDQVLERLELVKRSGTGWTARCPAHEDRNPSLSVREGDGGKVLLHCHAGCSYEAIAAALGLPARDDAQEWTPGGPAVAVYDYVDENGGLLFQVCRTAEKQFPQRRPDPTSKSGYRWKLDGVRRVLYRLPSVRAAIEAGETIYVVEGEKDVHALERLLGFEGVATTAPQGAGKWLDEYAYAEQLRGAQLVAVIADDDQAGREHARQVARSLARAGIPVKLVELWPVGDTGRDVSDFLALPSANGAGPDQAKAAFEAIVDATPLWPPPETDSEPPSQPESVPFALELRTAREVCELPEPERSDELCGPILRRRARTIVAARTGEGKTVFTAQLVAAVVEQRDFLGWTGAGGRALIIDLEQDISDAKRVLREAGLAASDDVDYIMVPDGLGLDEHEEQQAVVEALLARGAYDVVVIDPHYKAQSGDSETPDNSPLMRLLDRWRAEYGFALILPMHARNAPPGIKTRLTVDDISGYGVRVRGAEVILLLELVGDGYSRLTFGKIRGVGPARETWGLLYNREHGFRRDPKDEAPPRDLAAEIDAYLTEHPRSTTNAIAKGINAGKGSVSSILKANHLFSFEAGPNRSRLWVVSDAQNHPGHLFGPSGGPGDLGGSKEPPGVTTTHGGSEEPGQ